MATESVEEILTDVAESAWSLGLQGANLEELHSDRNNRMTPKKAKAALQAYYTRECARKVLEGRLDELEHYYEAGHKVAMQHAPTFEELAAAYDDHLVDRIAELRAAIQELGDAMPEPQQPKPLEEKI